jgi:hypothetical protein
MSMSNLVHLKTTYLRSDLSGRFFFFVFWNFMLEFFEACVKRQRSGAYIAWAFDNTVLQRFL